MVITEQVDQPPEADTSPAEPSSRVRRVRRLLLAILLVSVLVEAAGFGVTYFGRSSGYVSTDNAQVDGDQITITAPASGILTRWVAVPGAAVRAGQIVGRVARQNTPFYPQVTIRAPGTGVVAVTTAAEGEYVRQGARLAVAVDPQRVYVTARLEEDDVKRVRAGQAVDIDLDARPDRPLHGVVTSVQLSTAGELARFPSIDVDPANPQPVRQYVPVRVALTDPPAGGVPLILGTSVTVLIHIDR